jgi:hypothetical protein
MSDSPGSPEPSRPRRSMIRRSALLVAVLIALAATLAACGGGGSSTSDPSTTNGAASSGGSSSSGVSNSQAQEALKYAQCMRSHGVSNYADPAPGKSQSIGQSGIDTNSPTYQAAATACQEYQSAPINNSNQQNGSAGLKFAQCMRSHGVTNFPESTTGSGQQSLSQYGVDTNSPTFQRANQACGYLLGP